MSKKTLFIKPAKEGAVVRFPDNPARKLLAKGEKVEPGTYWTRRILDGSVVDPEAVKKAAAAKEEANKKAKKEAN